MTARLFLAVATIVLLAGCGSSDPHAGHTTAPTATQDHAGHTGATGNGLDASSDGFTLNLVGQPQAGELAFTVSGADGKPVTRFQVEQTKLMHVYLVRADTSHYQHLHPEMAADGTWKTPMKITAPGPYRVFADFAPSGAAKRVLSREFTVPGAYQAVPVPPAAPSGIADGYTLTLDGSPQAGKESDLTLTVSKAGAPVTDLQSYLDAFAHITAFRSTDLALTHLHPEGGHGGHGKGGPTLKVLGKFPGPGTYRMYVQFQTTGQLHTAALTVNVA